MRQRQKLKFGRSALLLVGTLFVSPLSTLSLWANDSTAELATGGLVLRKTTDIEMRTEDLYISADEIRVNYRFFNRASQDRTVTVAFPMPDISVSGLDENIALPTENPENILDFATRAGGRPVETRVEQKVFAKGIDQTALLRRLGVPLQPQLESTNKVLDALPQSQWPTLIDLGLAEVQDNGMDREGKKHLQARWTLKTSYFWEQTFPSGKELLIEHRYKPSVGRSAVTSLASPGAEKEEWYKEYLQKYCLDRYFIGAIVKARRIEKTDFPAFQEQRIAYILTTGANWAAPIKSFHLVIDKGDPTNLVSFCGDAVKVTPTQFELTKNNYMPKNDLNVLILKKTQQ